ncbi:sce7725 family protein [Phocoenobacter atlanticus]|uniref:sce7725 family protein n=1 Tax=Phocoenobacter atlanticus TaxID=3416742 RepID=UPI00275BE9C4|nr:sce7725 family protein [Pasteurella atlantica]MDP8101026.1 sce7725 family protein [Pasteurella atlantica]
MYQPYVRGKQFELIGIRELIENVLAPNKEKVSPIIEPVKDSSTLKTTLSMLVQHDVNFTIIINPQVGTFADIEKIFDSIQNSIENSKNYQIGIIFHNKIDHLNIIKFLKKYKSIVPALTIIHNTVFNDIENIINTYQENFKIKYNVINLSYTTKRYHRNFHGETRVELDDYFDAKSRNADYLQIDESSFSEEHLYYKEDGFTGFGDYLCIGEEYSETGFLPYAVAIHLSYAEKETNRIKIKHFVSNSNDDQSDIGGKFSEALDKLIAWCDEEKYDSISVPIFREYHKSGHFPGLGTLKKLSLMNHIDLVLRLI